MHGRRRGGHRRGKKWARGRFGPRVMKGGKSKTIKRVFNSRGGIRL